METRESVLKGMSTKYIDRPKRLTYFIEFTLQHIWKSQFEDTADVNKMCAWKLYILQQTYTTRPRRNTYFVRAILITWPVAKKAKNSVYRQPIGLLLVMINKYVVALARV